MGDISSSPLQTSIRHDNLRKKESEANPNIDPDALLKLRKLEHSAAIRLRQYLTLRGKPDNEAADNALLAVTQLIERLLDWHSSHHGSPNCSCDGLVVHSITVRKQYRGEIRGLMIWDVVNQYVDVFEASMRLARERDELEDDVLRFGKRGSEFRRIAYDDSRVPLRKELENRGEWEWACEFRKSNPQ